MTDPLSISVFLILVALSVVFLLWVLWRVELDIRRTRAKSHPCPAPAQPTPAPRKDAQPVSWPAVKGSRLQTR